MPMPKANTRLQRPLSEEEEVSFAIDFNRSRLDILGWEYCFTEGSAYPRL